MNFICSTLLCLSLFRSKHLHNVDYSLSWTVCIPLISNIDPATFYLHHTINSCTEKGRHVIFRIPTAPTPSIPHREPG